MDIIMMLPVFIIGLLVMICVLLVVFLLRLEKRVGRIETHIRVHQLELTKLARGTETTVRRSGRAGPTAGAGPLRRSG